MSRGRCETRKPLVQLEENMIFQFGPCHQVLMVGSPFFRVLAGGCSPTTKGEVTWRTRHHRQFIEKMAMRADDGLSIAVKVFMQLVTASGG